MLKTSKHARKYKPEFNMPTETIGEKWHKAVEKEGLFAAFLVFALCVDMILLCVVVIGGTQQVAHAEQDDGMYMVTPSDQTNWRVVEASNHEHLKKQWANVIEQLELIDEERAKMEEQALIEEKVVETEYYPDYAYFPIIPSNGNGDLRHNGVESDGTYQYTWYSQNALPGSGLDIPGRHVGESGYVQDGDGNICVASSDLAKGTVVDTPYGQAKVYDTGCASGVIDVYTNW